LTPLGEYRFAEGIDPDDGGRHVSGATTAGAAARCLVPRSPLRTGTAGSNPVPSSGASDANLTCAETRRASESAFRVGNSADSSIVDQDVEPTVLPTTSGDADTTSEAI
jgi:hypothetical protein